MEGIAMLSEKQKLDALARLGVDLNRIQDLDILMESILTEARRFVNADAGSIYIRDKDMLHFTYTQNDTLQGRLAEGQKLIYATFRIPINGNSIAGFAAESGRPLNLPDVYRLDPACPYRFDKEFDKTAAYLTRSVLTIPVRTRLQRTSGGGRGLGDHRRTVRNTGGKRQRTITTDGGGDGAAIGAAAGGDTG